MSIDYVAFTQLDTNGAHCYNTIFGPNMSTSYLNFALALINFVLAYWLYRRNTGWMLNACVGLFCLVMALI